MLSFQLRIYNIMPRDCEQDTLYLANWHLVILGRSFTNALEIEKRIRTACELTNTSIDIAV